MFEEMVRDGIIEVEAMAFIQGRSIPRSIIILDEAENISPREARMVVERCGKDSKVILLGDLSQAVGSVPLHVERSHVGKQGLGSANVAGGLVSSNVLLSGLH